MKYYEKARRFLLIFIFLSSCLSDITLYPSNLFKAVILSVLSPLISCIGGCLICCDCPCAYDFLEGVAENFLAVGEPLVLEQPEGEIARDVFNLYVVNPNSHLTYLCHFNKEKLIAFIIENGVSLNEACEPLREAIRGNKIKIAKYFIERGAPIYSNIQEASASLLDVVNRFGSNEMKALFGKVKTYIDECDDLPEEELAHKYFPNLGNSDEPDYVAIIIANNHPSLIKIFLRFFNHLYRDLTPQGKREMLEKYCILAAKLDKDKALEELYSSSYSPELQARLKTILYNGLKERSKKTRAGFVLINLTKIFHEYRKSSIYTDTKVLT